jgi:NAD(P)-dependent dehydrogenase (short-subunit alcohol dehydrogenase family)
MTQGPFSLQTMHVPSKNSPASFAGQVVLITGTSDQGIGGAVAEHLADRGAAVTLVAPDEPKRLVKRLRRRERRFHWADCDVTQPSQVQQAIEDCREKFGPIDILVNNAGIEQAGRIETFTDEQCETLLAVNLSGAIRVTRMALSNFNEAGVIVNVSSALALGGCPGFSVYSASKAGLDGFTQSLAWELAPRRIRVVGVAPGLVHSAMIHKHLPHLTDEVRQMITACHPLGMGMPQDVASVIAFLASDEARWITGVTIPVGWTYSYPLPVAQFLE